MVYMLFTENKHAIHVGMFSKKRQLIDGAHGIRGIVILYVTQKTKISYVSHWKTCCIDVCNIVLKNKTFMIIERYANSSTFAEQDDEELDEQPQFGDKDEELDNDGNKFDNWDWETNDENIDEPKFDDNDHVSDDEEGDIQAA
jgi:hypothetical protein